MNGLKTTTLTLEQMRSRRAQGASKTDWARLKREVAAGVEPADDEDSPDATQTLRGLKAKQVGWSGRKRKKPIPT